MTDKQPEALRLADELEYAIEYDYQEQAAAELRRLHQSEIEGWRYAAELEQERKRLHEINQELVEALKLAKTIIGHPDDTASKYITETLNKATGENND